MKRLNIKTSDGETFNVDLDVARQSQTIWTMLDDILIKESKENRGGEKTMPIFKEELTGPVFKKMLTWMEENRGKPRVVVPGDAMATPDFGRSVNPISTGGRLRQPN